MHDKDKEMLEWVQFVTDKFEKNHRPWVYRPTGSDSSLDHIRYKQDTRGYFSWRNRIKRFLRDISINYVKPTRITKALMGTGVPRYRNWFHIVRVAWNVHMELEDHLPDATVNGNITHWAEDGEYITMFSPIVGREVLKFINADPYNMHAQNILKRMREVHDSNWDADGLPKNISSEDLEEARKHFNA